MSALTIIYVPGLFDRTRFLLSAQWAALRLWRPLGARVRMFTVGWAGEIAWEERLAALIAMIDARHERGETVALVGASAGASAVLGAFSARSDVVAGQCSFAGKFTDPTSSRNLFLTSMTYLKMPSTTLPSLWRSLTRRNGTG